MRQTIAILLIVGLVFLPMPLARGDDSDIFGANIEPNVMIFLDTSGSMNDLIGTFIPYNPNTTYCSPATQACPATYTSTVVYKKQGSKYTVYASSISSVTCVPSSSNCQSRNSLSTNGYWTGKIGGSNVNLYVGNYLNYYNCDICDGQQTKITIAKTVFADLINNTTGVRFGLMTFENNGSQLNPPGSGKVIAQIGADNTTLINAVNSMSASGWTPLGEAMTDVNSYFGGQKLIDGTQFPSPIQYSCQPNFVIVISDGMWNGNVDPQPVATTLYATDHSSTFAGTQNVIVDTVGFNLTGSDLQALPVLQGMAANGHGSFYTATDLVTLEQALHNAIEQILAATFSFATPVVPTTSTTGSTKAYLAAFQSDPIRPFWRGYLKAYQRDSNGQIPVDGNNLPLASALVWDAGQQLSVTSSASRTIYTAVSGTRQSFDTSNANITAALLGVSTSTDRANIINFIRGIDAYDENSNGNTTEERAWKLGDIFHSTPALVTPPLLISSDSSYNSFKSNNASRTTVLLAGANDGMLHAFRESDGQELWGFIPPDLLGSLKNLTASSGQHTFYVDSSPIAVDIKVGTTWKTIVIFGERRGGPNYYALDITDTTNPLYLWSFTDSKINETWSEPAVGKVQMADGTTTYAAFVGGGYNTGHNNNSGKAFFVINLATGAKLWEYYNNSSSDDRQYMNFSLAASPTAVDLNGDGFIDRVYIGDVGGQLWKFDVSTPATLSGTLINNWPANTTGKRLFAADVSQANPPPSGEYYPNQAIYDPPSLSFDASGNLWVFFGTGDRNHPNNTSSNRFYGIKENTNMTNGSALTEASLVDVTSGHPTVSQGWFLRLGANEKDLAAADVFNQIVLFTTFTPTTAVMCGSGGGNAKLYAVNLLSGDAAVDVTTGNTIAFASAIGQGIPSKPVIILQNSGNQGNTSAITGTTNQQIYSTPLPPVSLKRLVGWREVF